MLYSALVSNQLNGSSLLARTWKACVLAQSYYVVVFWGSVQYMNVSDIDVVLHICCIAHNQYVDICKLPVYIYIHVYIVIHNQIRMPGMNTHVHTHTSI